MASNSSIIACGPKMTMVAMGLKFLLGPALMAVASIVIGLRDTMLKVAIVQVFFFLILFRKWNVIYTTYSIYIYLYMI